MDEQDTIERLVEINLKTLWSKNGVTKRGQHGKHHGCVKAKFSIDPDLADTLAMGIFQPGDEYDCLIRFSNGRRSDDCQKDAHGMAIKLLRVEGEKSLAGEEGSEEQDFLLVDHPVFFCSGLEDYMTFNRHFTPFLDLSVNGVTLSRLFRGILGLIALGLFHRPLLKRAQAFAGHTMASPLASHYHSTTPYRLGPHAVKYRATSLQPATGACTEPNELKSELWNHIATRPSFFEFGIVLQTDAERQPIDDATVEWDANGGAYKRIATIEIPKQIADPDNDQRAEALVFNPWRCLKPNEPIGAVNRARLAVYQTLSKIRQENNS